MLNYLSDNEQYSLISDITIYINKMRQQFTATNFKDSYRHLAILLDNKIPLLYGTNCDRIFYRTITRHAEIDVLVKLNNIPRIKAKRHLNLLVIRLSKTDQLCNSKPCKYCIAYMREYNIKYVYYSTAERKIVKQLFSQL